MDCTAVTLSPRPLKRSIPGCEYLNAVGCFKTPGGHMEAWLRALRQVRTPWFTFIDSDDDLPDDFERILGLCMSVDTPVAYTDELITHADGTSRLRKGQPYSQDAHIGSALLLHHLVVCKTEAALRAAEVVPTGDYAVEMLLFFQVAKEGATYIPETGYIWHRRNGLSSRPKALISQVHAKMWAARNR